MRTKCCDVTAASHDPKKPTCEREREREVEREREQSDVVHFIFVYFQLKGNGLRRFNSPIGEIHRNILYCRIYIYIYIYIYICRNK